MSVVLKAKTRLATEGDEIFLRALYADTRGEEMALTGWPPDQCARFLSSQFELQKRHYDQHFGPEGHSIVELDRQPVGRLWLHDDDERRLIVDISLMADARGRGLGASLIRKTLAQARRNGRPCVRLHVLSNNPGAMRLYQRIGFTVVGAEGAHLRMEWRPIS